MKHKIIEIHRCLPKQVYKRNRNQSKNCDINQSSGLLTNLDFNKFTFCTKGWENSTFISPSFFKDSNDKHNWFSIGGNIAYNNPYIYMHIYTHTFRKVIII